MKEKTRSSNVCEKNNKIRKALIFFKFLKRSQKNDLIPKEFILCDKFFSFFFSILHFYGSPYQHTAFSSLLFLPFTDSFSPSLYRSFPSPQHIPHHDKKNRTRYKFSASFYRHTFLRFYIFTESNPTQLLPLYIALIIMLYTSTSYTTRLQNKASSYEFQIPYLKRELVHPEQQEKSSLKYPTHFYQKHLIDMLENPSTTYPCFNAPFS
ncbi:hypothetical protein, partial [Bartonella rattimassiliensis]